MNKRPAAEQARNYAFLLLKYRMRSEDELRRRLTKKKFSPPVIAETLSFLREKRFIDDRDFARAWADSRLKRPVGARVIRQELRLKGVEQGIIDEEIKRIAAEHPEAAVVGELARNRIARLKGIEPEKAKRRVFAYLMRRGFAPESIIEAMNNI